LDEKEMLRRVTEDKEFMRRLLIEDRLDDWGFAKEWAEFVLRIDPEDLVHHLILVRAYRHLGDTHLAIAELAKCRAIIESGNLGIVDEQVVLPMVDEEKRLLLSPQGSAS
jgi:hypothetical protein